MRSLGYRVVTLCAFGVCATLLTGQSSGQVGSGTPAAPKRVIQPYTAEFKTVSEKTLANGTTIRHETTRLVEQDSEGRTYTATQFVVSGSASYVTAYTLYDPVARTVSNWFQNGKMIDVSNLPPESKSEQAVSRCSSSAPPAPAGQRLDATSNRAAAVSDAGSMGTVPMKDVREDLGTETFHGLEAKGTLITQTIPIGAIGNDAPLVSTTEVWTEVSIPLTVRQVVDSPEGGKSVEELTRYAPGEPDPANFQLPPGYEIAVHESLVEGCTP